MFDDSKNIDSLIVYQTLICQEQQHFNPYYQLNRGAKRESIFRACNPDTYYMIDQYQEEVKLHMK